MTAGEIVAKLSAAAPRLGGVRLLAIDGPAGSGKSTLAAQVVARLRARGVTVALVPTDHFATWDDPVSWWSRLAVGVLEPLAAGRPGRYRRMDWSTGVPRLGDWVSVELPEVLVVEGVSAGRALVRPRLSLLVWVEYADQAARLARLIARDGDGTREPFRRWQEFEHGWFAIDGTQAAADEYVSTPRRAD